MGNFVFTDAMNNDDGIISTVMPFVSIIPCLGILIAAGWVYTVPGAREKLNRISFRLMLWTMVLEVGYNICLALTDPIVFNATGDAVGCAVVVYFQLACQSGTNYLCTAIAINLALYVSYHVDTVTRRFERWYVGLSLFLAFVIPLPAAIIGNFGSDPLYGPGVCYFTSDDPYQREIQFVLDIYLWQAISTTVATVAIVIVMVTLIRQGRETTRLLFSNTSNLASSSNDIEMNHNPHQETYLSRHVVSDLELHYLQHKLRTILLRISMYPIFLIIVSVILMVGDLYTSAENGPHSWAGYVLLVIYTWLFSARSLPFAILGLFVDPSLIRGIREAWNIKRGRVLHGQSSSITPILDSDGIMPAEGADCEVEIDFMSALNGPTSTPLTTYIWPLHVSFGNGTNVVASPDVKLSVADSSGDKFEVEGVALPELLPDSPQAQVETENSVQIQVETKSNHSTSSSVGRQERGRTDSIDRRGLRIQQTRSLSRQPLPNEIRRASVRSGMFSDIESSRRGSGGGSVRPRSSRFGSHLSSDRERRVGDQQVGEEIRKALEVAVQRM